MLSIRSGRHDPAWFMASIRVFMALAMFAFSIFDFDGRNFIIDMGSELTLLYLVFSVVLLFITRACWWLGFKLFNHAFVVDCIAFLIIPSHLDPDGLGYYTASFAMIGFLIACSGIRWGARIAAVNAVILNIACFLTCQVAATGKVFFLRMDMMSFEEEVRRIIFQGLLSLVIVMFLNRNPMAPQVEDLPPHLEGAGVNHAAILKYAMMQARAQGSALYWGRGGASAASRICHAMTADSQAASVVPQPPVAISSELHLAKLVDLDSGRALCLEADGGIVACKATAVDGQILAATGGRSGIWTRLESDSGDGWLLLVDVKAIGWDKLGLVRVIGAQVEHALVQAELASLARDAAVVQLRNSIASDLHDGVIQSLMGAQYWLRSMIKRPNIDVEVKDEISNLDSAISVEVKHIRDTINRVREADIIAEEQDLKPEMNALAEVLSAYWKIDVVLKNDVQSLIVNSVMSFNLEQIVREAVSNSVRHGGATQVVIDFSADGSHVTLSVSDNGSGFRDDPVAQPPRSIHERISALGGTCSISSRLGQTRIEVSLSQKEASNLVRGG